MFHYIDEKLNLYNANARGKSVGDCVKRSISMAFDIPYKQVEKELNEVRKSMSRYTDDYTAYTYDDVYTKVIKKHASNYMCVSVGEKITLQQFCDENPMGVFLVETGGMSSKYSNHLVCVLNGDVWDSWDSTRERVFKYYVCDVVDNETGEIVNATRNFTDIGSNLNELFDYMSQKISSTFATYTDSFAKKYGINPSDISIINYKTGDYQYVKYHLVSPYFRITFKGEDIGWWTNVDVALTPTTAPEDVKSMIDNAVVARVRQLFNKIVSEIKVNSADSISDELFARAGYEYDNSSLMYLMNSREKSLYTALIKKYPQIKKFIRSIDIQNPGVYSDSVKVKMLSLPDDPRFDSSKVDNKIYIGGNPNMIDFECYEVSDVKDMIRRYMASYERPYDDYEPTEDY